MTIPLLLMFALAAASPQEPGAKKVPSDSVEVGARGCLKGRVFAATARAEDEGVRLGPDIAGRSFRIAAKKEVMAVVKQHDGHWVEIEGIVKKADLEGYTLGTKIGGARVVIGQPGRDPMRTNYPTPPAVPVMDVSAVRFLSETCPVK